MYNQVSKENINGIKGILSLRKFEYRIDVE